MQCSSECMLSRQCMHVRECSVRRYMHNAGALCIVYDETKDAMQDARWCYVPTDHVAADRQQQMAG